MGFSYISKYVNMGVFEILKPRRGGGPFSWSPMFIVLVNECPNLGLHTRLRIGKKDHLQCLTQCLSLLMSWSITDCTIHNATHSLSNGIVHTVHTHTHCDGRCQSLHHPYCHTLTVHCRYCQHILTPHGTHCRSLHHPCCHTLTLKWHCRHCAHTLTPHGH